MTFVGRWGGEQDHKQVLVRMDEIEQLVGRFHPGSRLALFRGRFKAFLAHRGNPWAHVDASLLAEGLRDFEEISFVFGVLRQDHPEVLLRYLPALLSGSAVPTGDANPFARNLQYQLFIGALFVHSGFAVRFEEPDMLFDHGGKWWGIAAKRPAGPNGLRRRLREGIQQVKKASLEGIVALSFDRVLSQKNPLLLAERPGGLWDFGERTLPELIKNHKILIMEEIDRPHVLAVITSLSVPALVKAPPQLSTYTATFVIPSTPDEKDNRYTLSKSIAGRLKSPQAFLGKSPLLGQGSPGG